jgi:DNA-binding protein HU-beta
MGFLRRIRDLGPLPGRIWNPSRGRQSPYSTSVKMGRPGASGITFFRFFFLTFILLYLITTRSGNSKPTKEEPKMAEKKPMTKSQIVSHFANKFDLPKKTAGSILEEVAALAVSETRKVGSFALPGVGKLVLSRRKARMGFNPATGEQIKIPAKTVAKMRLAKSFKETVVPPKK